MTSSKMDKFYAVIAPATALNNISLDYNATLSYGDLYTTDLELIGAGGFGVVVASIDKKSHTAFAIKILNINKYIMMGTPPESRKLNRQGSWALIVERNLNWLANEVAIMSELSHPNIVQLVRVSPACPCFRLTRHNIMC